MEDPQTEEIYKKFSQKKVADQIVKIINNETIIQDQIQFEVFTQFLIDLVLTRTLETDTFLRIVQGILQTTEIETNRIVETELIQIINHGITLTKDHIITITIIDPVITLGVANISNCSKYNMKRSYSNS